MTKSLDKTPIRPDGSPDGPSPEPESASAAIAAHLAGVPDLLPPQWCPNCKADVLPRGKGLCPRCGRVLKHSFLARRHPINKLRKQQILEKLVADYRPSTTMLQATCEHLAGTLEQLEVLKPGSQEWQRLTQMAQQLAAALEASRASRVKTDDLDDMTVDQLVEKTTGFLHSLLEMRDAKPTSDASPFNSSPIVAKPEALDGSESIPSPPTPPAPAPEPVCEYCKRTCVGVDHHAYSVLHWEDPAEIDKRAERATAEMLHQLGKPSPWDYQPVRPSPWERKA
jgi:hypothetical protein